MRSGSLKNQKMCAPRTRAGSSSPPLPSTRTISSFQPTKPTASSATTATRNMKHFLLSPLTAPKNCRRPTPAKRHRFATQKLFFHTAIYNNFRSIFMIDPIHTPLQPPFVTTEMTPPRQPALTVREVPPINRFTVQSPASTPKLTRCAQTALPRYIQQNLEQEKWERQKNPSNCCDCIIM